MPAVRLPPADYRIRTDKRLRRYIHIQYPRGSINNVRVDFENLDEFNDIYSVCRIDSHCLFYLGLF